MGRVQISSEDLTRTSVRRGGYESGELDAEVHVSIYPFSSHASLEVFLPSRGSILCGVKFHMNYPPGPANSIASPSYLIHCGI